MNQMPLSTCNASKTATAATLPDQTLTICVSSFRSSVYRSCLQRMRMAIWGQYTPPSPLEQYQRDASRACL